MLRITAVIDRDFNHKRSALTSVKWEEVGRCRRKLRNDVFVDVCVGKDDDVMEVEMDVCVTYMGVKRN